MNGDITETDAKLYAVIGRAIADPAFRLKLMNEETQEAALREHGLDWNDNVRAALAGADQSIQALNTALENHSIVS